MIINRNCKQPSSGSSCLLISSKVGLWGVDFYEEENSRTWSNTCRMKGKKTTKLTHSRFGNRVQTHVCSSNKSVGRFDAIWTKFVSFWDLNWAFSPICTIYHTLNISLRLTNSFNYNVGKSAVIESLKKRKILVIKWFSHTRGVLKSIRN